MRTRVDDKDLNKFLTLLFDDEDITCYSRDCFNTNLEPCPTEEDLFFSINPMTESRKDANVTKYRNFLIEIDDMDLGKQIKFVTDRLPVSTIAYSGSKSYHFIISLEEPLRDIEEYREVSQRILATVPSADKTTKNPSRFSRLPCRIRPETDKSQELVYVGARIPLEKLLSKLVKVEKRAYDATRKQEGPNRWVRATVAYAVEFPDLFINERGFSGRNQFFFFLYNRLVEEGYGPSDIQYYVDLAYEHLEDKTNFTINEAYLAARIR